MIRRLLARLARRMLRWAGSPPIALLVDVGDGVLIYHVRIEHANGHVTEIRNCLIGPADRDVPDALRRKFNALTGRDLESRS